MDKHGYSNTEHCACLPKKTNMTLFYPQKEVFQLPNSSNNMEHFTYKSEWADTYMVIHLKEGLASDLH